MDVTDFVLQRTAELQQEVHIFNPLEHDFTWNWEQTPYTIPSKELKGFKKHIAEHLGKHIVDEYVSHADVTREEAEKLVFPV